MEGWLVDDIRVDTYGPPSLVAVGDPFPGPALTMGLPRPNSVLDRTRIRFSLSSSSPVEVAVYDVSGRQVRVLSDGFTPAGAQELEWDGRNAEGRRVPAGAYYVRVVTPQGTASQKLQLLRR